MGIFLNIGVQLENLDMRFTVLQILLMLTIINCIYYYFKCTSSADYNLFVLYPVINFMLSPSVRIVKQLVSVLVSEIAPR